MSKRKNKKDNKLVKFIYIIFLILSTIFTGIITYLKVLPYKYIIALIVIYALLNVIFGLLSFKKHNAITGIICFIFSCLFAFGLYYLNTTMNFMSKIMASDYQIENYYVYVLKDSDYHNINDLKDKKIGIPNISSNTYDSAYDKLNKKLSFEEEKYENIVSLVNDLFNEKIYAIFVNETALSFIKDEVDNFENNTKVLYTIPIKIKIDETSKDVDLTKDSFNIYISGIDVYGDISSVSRSDVNMIMTVNPNTNKILLTSIPRDYYVRLHGTTGYKDKLTHAGLYGINMSITTLEDLFGIYIDYYIRVNFTTLINIVDAIGGIDINSDLAFTAHTNSSCTYAKGNNHLDGKCALAFSRERYAYQEGDRHRVQNQQVVLTAILNKALSSKTLITKYTNILESLESSFQTNMPQENIYSLVNMQLDQMPKWNIQTISVNGKDSFNYTYSYSANKLYVMEPNMQTVAIATAKMKEVES